MQNFIKLCELQQAAHLPIIGQFEVESALAGTQAHGEAPLDKRNVIGVVQCGSRAARFVGLVQGEVPALKVLP
jgi:hypothetical protein